MVSVPPPCIFAPAWFKNVQSSSTSGSLAQFFITTTASDTTDAKITFCTAPTLG